MRALAFLVYTILALTSFSALSSEKAEVCLKYRKDYDWSHGYSVQGTVLSGFELGSAIGNFMRFKSYATYVVVFWKENQASIFELPPMSLGRPPAIETEVEDQEGRKWKISDGQRGCH